MFLFPILGWIALGLFVVGGSWFGIGTFEGRNLPESDPMKGLYALPGFLMLVASMVFCGFFAHWIIGVGVFIGVCIFFYRLIAGKY